MAETETITDILNAISELYDGESAEVIADAISNIAEVVGDAAGAEDKLAGLIDRSLTSIKIPNGTTMIGFEAFNGCKSLASVEIPSSVTKIGSHAFNICESLASIDIPSSVTEIGIYAFAFCKSLASVEMSSVTTIKGSAFKGCTALTEIEIPSSVTTIESQTFLDCDNLETITVHKAEGSITGAPWGAPNTTQIIWDGE